MVDGKGPFPGVIVLDVTGGNQMLSRHISTYLARARRYGLTEKDVPHDRTA